MTRITEMKYYNKMLNSCKVKLFYVLLHTGVQAHRNTLIE